MIRIFNLSAAHPALVQLLSGQAVTPLVAEESNDVRAAVEQVPERLVAAGSSGLGYLTLLMDENALPNFLQQLKPESSKSDDLKSDIPPPPKVPSVQRPIPAKLSRPIVEKVFAIKEWLELLPTQAVHFMIDENGVHILHANREACRIAGMTEEEMQAAEFHNLVFPEDLGRMMFFIKDTVEKRTGILEEVRLLAYRDGEQIYVPSDVLTIMPEKGNEGIAIVIDQTRRHEYMQALERSRAELVRHREQFLKGPAACIIVLDERGYVHVTDVSHALEKLLGHSRDVLMRLKITDLFAERSLPQFGEMLQLLQGLGDRVDEESNRQFKRFIWMRRKDGREIPVDIVASLGSLDGKVFVRVDFTDAQPRQRQEELERVSATLRREQDKLLAMRDAGEVVAHDVNNGLTGVRAWIKRARYFLIGAKHAFANVDEAEGAQSLKQLIEQLVQKGHVSPESQQQATSRSAMFALIMDACAEFQLQADQVADQTGEKVRQLTNYQPGIREIGTFRVNSVIDKQPIVDLVEAARMEVKFSLNPEAGYVNADRNHLDAVLGILIQNGIDAMEHSPNKQLTIMTGNETYEAADIAELKRHVTLVNEGHMTPGDKVIISVQDTGEGIEPDRLLNIFEPTYSTRDLSPTSVTHEAGRSGTSLFKAMSIIDGFLGSIGVTSYPGRGSTFMIYLPRTEPTRDSVAGMRIG